MRPFVSGAWCSSSCAATCKHSVEVMMLLCGTRRAETGPARRERSKPTPLGEECGVATADDRADVPEAAAPGGATSSEAFRPARESVRERVAHLRERAERTRAG